MGDLVGQPDGQEHVGGIQGAGGTGGAAGTADSFHVQLDEQGLALDKLECEVHVVGQTVFAGAVDPGIGNLGHDAVHQVVTQAGLILGAFLQRGHGQLHGLAVAHDTGYIFRAGTALALLGAAVDERADLHALADIEETDALGAV